MAIVKAISERKDGGFYFPELQIHVVAKTEAKAKELVKEYHNIDVDAKTAELREQEKDLQSN